MLKRALILSGMVIALSACGGGDSGNGTDDKAAEDTYKQSCASCHGENLEGASGPALKDVGKKMGKDEILKQIEEGSGGMPGGLVKGDEAKNVAEWLAEKK